MGAPARSRQSVPWGGLSYLPDNFSIFLPILKRQVVLLRLVILDWFRDLRLEL
jgi:hypothetical protein